MSNKIEINYADIDSIRRRLHQLADTVEEDIKRQLLRHLYQLENNGWQGRAAREFYDEMYTRIMPSLEALINTLDEGANAAQQTIDLFNEAEADSIEAMERNILN